MTLARSINIQVIDQEKQTRRLIAEAVGSFEARILESGSLAEADQELPASNPDFIMMDCLQPDGDGLAWLISRRNEGFSTPVFFLNSGSNESEYFFSFFAVPGIKAVLHKPVSPTCLRQVLSEHLAGVLPAPAVEMLAHLDEIEREIKELGLEYVSELPERFQTLTEQVEDYKLGRGELSAAKSEAHKIKGTASSYGFSEIGDQAVVIDRCLKELSIREGVVEAELWPRLEHALREALRLSRQAAKEAEAEKLLAESARTSRPGTAVIVGSDQETAERISQLLAAQDLLVYQFTDAEKLIEILELLPADLLIIDANVAPEGGARLCRRLRALARLRRLPVVVSGAESQQARAAAIEAGADDYVCLPDAGSQIISSLRARLEKSRLQDAAALKGYAGG